MARRKKRTSCAFLDRYPYASDGACVIVTGLAAISADMAIWREVFAQLYSWLDAEKRPGHWRAAAIGASKMFGLFSVELYIDGDLAIVRTDDDLLETLAAAFEGR